METHAKIPAGPKGFPYFGSLFNFAAPNRLDWLSGLMDQYGDVVTFRILKEKYYLINHPDYIKEILTSKMSQYTKNTGGFEIVKKVLGESVFTSTGETWQRKRRLAQPQFHKMKINQFSSLMTDAIEEMLVRWEQSYKQNEPIDIKQEMMRITLNVVMLAMFGTGLSKEVFEQVATVFTPILQETNRRALYPFKILKYLNADRNTEYKENIEILDKIIYSIIEERRKSNGSYNDLLQMLIEAKDEITGQPLDDTELRDEIMTVFIAGHETTANALSWLWITLVDRPKIYDNIQKEVQDVLGNKTPEFSDFPNLSYTFSTFRETLRLNPPVPMLPRKAEKDDQLGPYKIARGSTIFISPYFLHRHPDFWPEPEVFNPERFSPTETKKQHSFAYLPFGGGPRICIGFNFAYMEAVFIIAMIVQRFKLTRGSSSKTVKPLFEITYRPKGDVYMHLEHS